MKKISSCCEADLTPEYADSEVCPECNDHCGVEEVFECDDCGDTGVIDVAEYDHDAHEWVKVGEKKCICRK